MNAEAIALSIVILLFSVIVHEVMHGWVARMFGDHTAENAGRLTLNPLPHIDPIGTILIPFLLLVLPLLTGVRPGFLIGWAKPVPVNPLNFSNIRKGEFYVSLAGIGANLSLALISAIFYHLTVSVYGVNNLIASSLEFAVSINLMLAVFNLVPIPPLDGSKALMSQLPLSMAREYEKLNSYGFLIIIALLYFNVLNMLLSLIIIPLQKLLGVPTY